MRRKLIHVLKSLARQRLACTSYKTFYSSVHFFLPLAVVLECLLKILLQRRYRNFYNTFVLLKTFLAFVHPLALIAARNATTLLTLTPLPSSRSHHYPPHTHTTTLLTLTPLPSSHSHHYPPYAHTTTLLTLTPLPSSHLHHYPPHTYTTTLLTLTTTLLTLTTTLLTLTPLPSSHSHSHNYPPHPKRIQCNTMTCCLQTCMRQRSRSTPTFLYTYILTYIHMHKGMYSKERSSVVLGFLCCAFSHELTTPLHALGQTGH